MAISASIVVQFQGLTSESNAQLIAEVDSRDVEDGGLNDSTTFIGGDTVSILAYEEGLTSIQSLVSAGGIVKTGSGSRVIEEFVEFSNESEGTLRFPPASGLVVEWFGNDLGSVAYIGGGKVRAANSGVAVARITYTANYSIYQLAAPTTINGESEFTIVVVFIGVI